MATGREGEDKPILVPTHAQVLEQSRPQPPPSLFRPTSTFTEAFSFLKNSESYSPPPPRTASASGTSRKPDVAPGQARNAIIVSPRQQGNPMLKHIKNVRWMFADIVPDYVLGQSSCALYLSLRYHLLHPDYVYFRIRELQKSFRLRVVLCYVDVEDVVKPLHEVTKTALLHDCSLLCAWSQEECARYLETIKIYENKPADDIQERTDHDYLSRLTSALTTIRLVNKTNVVTLGSTFGTLAAIMGASMEELARCPGIGERKVKRLHDAFHEPFRRTTKQARLSSMGVTITSTRKNATQKDLSEEQRDILKTPEVLATETPEVSVCKALDAAYAKHGVLLHGEKVLIGSKRENN